MNAISTVDGHFDVIGGTFAVDDYSVFDGSFEFEVNVTIVTHIKCWQINGRIDNPEGYYVVEEI